jgi:prepilin-type N-terminal cleavage/methylation domain-containing protein/prepilin-type processing-associated H-X9-DG protein
MEARPDRMRLYNTHPPRLVPRGFSLVELLVVIAILAVIAALLLPAIQSARESARANSCRNNLKQVGIALANYESVQRHFPMGAQGRYERLLSPAAMYGLSWWTEILSYLEEQTISDQLDRVGANTGWGYLNAHNGALVNNFGPAYFFCPSSNVERFLVVGAFQVAATSYTGISGATNDDGFRETRVSSACCLGAQISGGGVLVPNAKISVSQITNGLSKTLLVGEQSDFAFSAKQGGQLRIGSSFVKGWIAGTREVGTPPDRSEATSPFYNISTIRYRLNEHNYDLPGVYLDAGLNSPLLSSHPSIVNVLYCDGSVHRLEDTIEVPVLKSLATRGDSPPEITTN